jgi:hypothetical protein
VSGRHLDLTAIRRRYAPPVSGPWDSSRGSPAEFIAHARRDVPALLDRIEELEEALELAYRCPDCYGYGVINQMIRVPSEDEDPDYEQFECGCVPVIEAALAADKGQDT